MQATTADPQILQLGPAFYDSVQPAKFPLAQLRYWNDSLAQHLGWHQWSLDEKQKHFWCFEALPGNLPKPLALRYHGHQFMTYNPELGDGRGFLFAQVRIQGQLYEFGTKGSGTTPYSRRGDGRLTLKGAVREALATELLESLGVKTSRSFCIFETGESLQRNDEPSPTRSAVLTRFSETHLRIGSFQRLAYLQETDNIHKLAKYVLDQYYPTKNRPQENSINRLYDLIIERHAKLAAQIMIAGFVHGVLNTDNLNLTGENFDYGPFRFLPTYKPDFTAAYFDHSGLYAYGQQPQIFRWNLMQLGLALKTAQVDLDVEAHLEKFGPHFSAEITRLFLLRLHLQSKNKESDENLLSSFYQSLYSTQALFEQSFFDFYAGADNGRWSKSPQHQLYKKPEFSHFLKLLSAYSPLDSESSKHLYFQSEKPVTLLYPEIEALWSSISERNDWLPFEEKLLQIRSFRGLWTLK